MSFDLPQHRTACKTKVEIEQWNLSALDVVSLLVLPQRSHRNRRIDVIEGLDGSAHIADLVQSCNAIRKRGPHPRHVGVLQFPPNSWKNAMPIFVETYLAKSRLWKV